VYPPPLRVFQRRAACPDIVETARRGVEVESSERVGQDRFAFGLGPLGSNVVNHGEAWILNYSSSPQTLLPKFLGSRRSVSISAMRWRRSPDWEIWGRGSQNSGVCE
jgi:hypothetical protein